MAADLKWSITNGDLQRVKQIVESAGMDINSPIDGRQPLHYACDFGQTEVVAYLLSRGAKIDALDNHGITPLLAAIFEGHPSTIKLLLAKGARRDLLSPDGRPYRECAESEEIRRLLAT